MAMCKGIYIIGAKRTPFCNIGGSLRELPASHAYAAAASDAIRSANVDANCIDNTVIGNAHFLSQCDGGKTARYCGLYSGVPVDRPALAVNKTCGSGLQAIVTSCLDIVTGSAKISLSGGTEIMSSLPFLVRNARFGTTLGKAYKLEDHIQNQFLDSYTGLTLQAMADRLAKKYGITREELDTYALDSHSKMKKAQEAKIFEDELTKLTVNLKNRYVFIEKDEIASPNINAEDLGCSQPYDSQSVITSGNSALPADGAAALLIASEEAVAIHDIKPLVRVVGWACVGVDPMEAGLGAVAAVKKLMIVTGSKVDNVDLFEINETFASQVLAFNRELEVDPERININGGAISVGHPVAATGARMATHLVHQLKRGNLKSGVVASSCGGGQGIAVMLENI